MTTTLFTNGVTQSDASWADDVDTTTYCHLTATAGTNTVTATGPVSASTYTAGQKFQFIPANTNTGATTLNVSCNSLALGAKNIFAVGAALIGGELRAGTVAVVVYDGTRFNLINPNISTQTATVTLTGCGSSPTATLYVSRVPGGLVTIFLSGVLTGTSNSTAKTITGIPVAYAPTSNHEFPVRVQDNGGTYVYGYGVIDSTGLITLFPSTVQAGNWTNTGTMTVRVFSATFDQN